MLVLSSVLVLTPAAAALPAGTPRILWNNLVTFGGITADSEAVGYPPSNMANAATNQEWRAAAAGDVEITITISVTANQSAVGIARHNFGSAGIAAEIGYYDETDTWVNLAGPQIPANDEPLLFMFTEQSLAEIVIRLASGSEAARAAVVYAGLMLIMERGVDVDADYLVPRFARKSEYSAPLSERGDYLGRWVTSQYIDGVQHSYSHLTADFFRDEMLPFIQAAQNDVPFFYAMRGDDGVTYDVSYLTFADDPMPAKSPVTKRYKVVLKLSGIIE